MSPKPQDFFVGVIDFFSILMPGALLTYLLRDDLGPRFLGARYGTLGDAEAWAVFLFSSYLLGHFAFLLGSWVLDERVYDPVRNATNAKQVERLAKGQKLSGRVARALAAFFLKGNADAAVKQAARIKERYLDPLTASSAINAFQWCKARLTLEKPDAMATIQRFEADSKFFRSLLVVLCVLVPWGAFTSRRTVAVASAVSLILAFWRYADQRVKATNQAYWYVITLEGSSAGAPRQVSEVPAGAYTHAGGVVFKQVHDQVKYLLVQAKNNPKEWVLPKGHIEAGEEMRETAVREVREETGVWARVKSDMTTLEFTAKGRTVKTRFHLMEALDEARPSDRNRRHEWLPLEKAVNQASYDESKDLLRLGEQRRAAL